MRGIGPLTVALALASLPAPASAQPALRIESRTDCPSRDAFALALSQWVRTADDAEWTAELARDGSSSELVVRAPDGQVAVARSVQSDDCAALAEVFAFIVQARFVELEMLPPEAIATPPAALSEPVPAAAGEPVPLAAPPPAQPAPPAEPAAPSSSPPAPRAPDLWLGLSLGAWLGMAPGLVSAVGQIDGALAPTDAIAIRVALTLALPTEQRAGIDTVSLLEGTARAGILLRLALGASELRPGVSIGAALRQAAATSIPGSPSATRFHPLVAAELEARVPLSGPVALRLGASVFVLPLGDDYRIEPAGTIARSPYGVAVLLAGLEIR